MFEDVSLLTKPLSGIELLTGLCVGKAPWLTGNDSGTFV